MDTEETWNALYQKVGISGQRDASDIVLILGAGVSSSDPPLFPTWQELVRLIGCSPEVGFSAKTVRRLIRRCWSYPRILGLLWQRFELNRCHSLNDGGDARSGTTKHDFAWAELVRHCLYDRARNELRSKGLEFPDSRPKQGRKTRDDEFAKFIKRRNRTLASIMDLCIDTSKADPTPRVRIGAVLTYNMDALLQNYDRALHGSPRRFRTIERASKRRHPGKLPLYHLHGLILPTRADERDDDADSLILCEDDYHARTDDPYSFANTTMQWALRDFVCVFVGCSLDDELMRRALYRAKEEQRKALSSEYGRDAHPEEPRHFAILKRDTDAELLAEDLKLLQVGPLWINDFAGDELPGRLERLRKLLDEKHASNPLLGGKSAGV